MNIQIDVDVDNIIENMDAIDRKNFFQQMKRNGYISKECIITDSGEVQTSFYMGGVSNDDFNQALKKLLNRGWHLTKEQEDYIINLAKRF